MKHRWQPLDYDGRVSVNQPRRYLCVCTRCGMEKDVTSRRRSWVVGFKPKNGQRVAGTNMKTPPCEGK